MRSLWPGHQARKGCDSDGGYGFRVCAVPAQRQRAGMGCSLRSVVTCRRRLRRGLGRQACPFIKARHSAWNLQAVHAAWRNSTRSYRNAFAARRARSEKPQRRAAARENKQLEEGWAREMSLGKVIDTTENRNCLISQILLSGTMPRPDSPSLERKVCWLFPPDSPVLSGNRIWGSDSDFFAPRLAIHASAIQS